jgi:DNA-binding SARP family transcriptional activator
VSVEYRVLGPVEALVDGRPAKLGGPRQRGVLVALLTRANSLVPASRVIDDLWDDEPPRSAANLVQGYVSHLRKSLGRDAIETRGTGYLARVGRDALDLHRFERLAAEGERALEDGRPAEAVTLLGEALAQWSGPALGDLVGEPFLQTTAARLEELRLLAVERRSEALLAAGTHTELLRDIDALVREHPLRERLRWLQMLALYRDGRQAEALEAFRAGRATLVEELGIEPGAALQELERAILRQDPELGGTERPGARAGPSTPDPARAILAVSLGDDALPRLMPLAETLARDPAHEVVIVRTVAEATDLAPATAALNATREEAIARGVRARSACFTSLTPGADLARLASEHDVDLLLVDAPGGLLEDARILALLSDAPCDVAVVVGGPPTAGPVLVPFAGADHDWGAIELGAWLAHSGGSGLRLAGASTGSDGRDASRLLASASLAAQRALGVAAQPLLVEPAPDALVAAADGAGAVVVGLTDRWRRDGLGQARTALATRAASPVLLVRRGVRPGGLAPRRDQTRFTWTIAG